jgi:tetratricopeptide (TPR) repeat protein/tRNA A-37 threonylcarbamoyl transferase component Bud32
LFGVSALMTMPNEETIFNEARRIESPHAREMYLNESCTGDESLRARVIALLSAHGQQESFLQEPVLGSRPAPELMGLSNPAGTVIGRYKLLEPIGEGGYGTVFMAEQTSPVQRRVALKIIKAGMDTRQVIARFEAERQALALMDHPNIAKVFDAGMTDAGRPYFVMELVKGVSIVKYCDEHHLPPRARLELFVQVCQAVQHAHQKGIIHRDLKPSNVLVALYDGKPVPKVIDFGIAKATGQKLTDATMFTGFGDVIGTLEYMSPEQAEMNQLDVDTRSDIYSLGVLLYELLTGSTPLENKRIKQTALMEVLRFIREEEPPSPSTRLSASQQLPSIASNRGLEPKKLSGIVHGELDWIVMKALEKDRARRYETANGFASDVQRYLDDEAVHACPPSATYRFRKFARRNKAALLTVVALMVALVGGTTVSTWQAVRATRATRAEQAALKIAKANEQAARESAKRADAERTRAEGAFYKARLAVNDVIVNAAIGRGKWSDMPVEYRKIITADALKYYESLIQMNGADPAVRYETGVALGNIGLMHWRFGEHDQAEKLYRRAAGVLDALVHDVPRPAEYRQQCAYRHFELGSTLRRLHRTDEAEKHFRIAIAHYETLRAETPGRLNISAELAPCYSYLIEVMRPGPEAQTLYRALVVTAEAACHVFITQTPSTTRPADQASREAGSLRDIAYCLVAVPASVGRDHQLVTRLGRAMMELAPASGNGWIALAEGHYLAGDYNAAQAAFGKAEELKVRWYVEDKLFFAMTLWRQGNQPRAMRVYQAVDKSRGTAPVGSIQREAAELMGITIPLATQPTSQPTSPSSG